MRRLSRFVAICLLVCVAGGLCVGYAEADRWTYPDTEEIALDPATYDGQQVLLFGEVQSVDPATLYGEVQSIDPAIHTVVITAGSDPELEFTVEAVPESSIISVREGAAIQVFGVLDGQSTTVVADEIVVDYRNGADFRYVYGSSLLGGLLAAGGFLWYWRVDPRKLEFVPRGDR